MVGRRTKTIPVFGTALCMALGLGLALGGLPAKAQPGSGANSGEAGLGTAQPPASADLDTNFWMLVRDSRDPDALQSYLASFPSGKFADEARNRLTTLRDQEKTARVTPAPAALPAPVAIAPPPTDNKELARALQQELKRVGCLGGEADGVWGEQSRSALKDFVRHAKLNIGTDEPNVSALDAAQSRRERVCPLVCGDDEKAVGDRCVPTVVNKPRRARQEPAQERRREPKRAWAERAAPEPRASSNSGKRICFGARPNEIVACP
jgi:putative peptidoglycan binding protein